MGQYEVIQFLKEHRGKWFTGCQLIKKVPMTSSTGFSILSRLRNHPAITYKREYAKQGKIKRRYLYAWDVPKGVQT